MQRGRKVCLKQAVPQKRNMAGHLNVCEFSAGLYNALVIRCANVTFIFPSPPKFLVFLLSVRIWYIKVNLKLAVSLAEQICLRALT